MLLFHGSNLEVQEPKLHYSRRSLDFGAGFYMTSDFEQASAWAKRVARIRGQGTALVNVYETGKDWNTLNILRFERADHDWLEFVTANRTQNPKGDQYDLIIGPVANDQTIDVLNLYLAGTITETIALELLLPQKLKDQYVLKTMNAVNAIDFQGVRKV